MEVFSFENRGEKRVVVSSNLPSSMDDEALINRMHVLMPKPPFSLGWQMSSQDQKAIGEVRVSSCMPDHQNLLIMVVIFSTKVLEKRTIDM